MPKPLREPAVSGLFYPDEKTVLEKQVSSLLETKENYPDSKAILVPHAGYIYSGKTAGLVFGSVTLSKSVLLIGPNHTGLGETLALYAEGCWRTPLGDTAIDEALAQSLRDADPQIAADTLAHLKEHSLEVELPFLQHLDCEIRIVPLVVGSGDYGLLEKLGEAMATVIQKSEETPMLVVSSDMTHFETAETAKEKDTHALEAMKALDPRALYEAVRKYDISMCGWAPAVAALVALNRLGATKGTLVDYTHSGEVTGDSSNIVAYAGMVFQ